MEYTYRFSPEQSHAGHFPFHDHPQFPILVDMLSRKEYHHLCLGTYFSEYMYPVFLDALRAYLTQDNTPHSLRGANIIFIAEDNKQDISTLPLTSEHCLLIALPISLLNNLTFYQTVEKLLAQPQCRLLLLAKNHTERNPFTAHCVFVPVNKPSAADTLTILKQRRTALENFHNVLIPDELLETAYLLAERYLSADNIFDHALLLLDSSAARGSIHQDTLTKSTMIQVLSSWTQIPTSHLTLTTFNLQEFIAGMQQQVLGQDAAINLLHQKLLQPNSRLEQAASPYFTFLFAGPEHSGKKTAAHALTEQLFQQLNVLYYAQATSTRIDSIADLKLQRSLEHHYTPLKEVIRQTPHAVIMFENIERASPVILDGLFEIFSTGYLHDQDGHLYNFRQAIIILSTTLGSERLTDIAKVHTQPDDPQHLDWMQLVMLDPKRDNRQTGHHYSPQDIAQEIIPEMTAQLPSALCQHLCIIPFLPLTQTVIEKIIRLKLKLLGKDMLTHYGIDLGYAPEVIRFLAKQATHTADVKKALQPLYISVEQAIANQTNTHRSRQLFLQLNETGQFLRCDCLDVSEVVS